MHIIRLNSFTFLHISHFSYLSLFKKTVLLSQAISSLKGREDTFEKIEEAIDFVNERLPSDDSHVVSVVRFFLTIYCL